MADVLSRTVGYAYSYLQILEAAVSAKLFSLELETHIL